MKLDIHLLPDKNSCLSTFGETHLTGVVVIPLFPEFLELPDLSPGCVEPYNVLLTKCFL